MKLKKKFDEFYCITPRKSDPCRKVLFKNLRYIYTKRNKIKIRVIIIFIIHQTYLKL